MTSAPSPPTPTTFDERSISTAGGCSAPKARCHEPPSNTCGRIRIEPTAAYVDSPWFPDVDDLTGGINGTRAALAELFTACAADTACNDTFPDLDRTWQASTRPARTRRRCMTPSRPLPATPSTSSSTPPSCCAPPASPSAATDRPTPANSRRPSPPPPNGEATPWLLATIAQDPIFCAGYRPFCIGQDGFSLGAYLTEFCRDQVPVHRRRRAERGRRR